MTIQDNDRTGEALAAVAGVVTNESGETLPGAHVYYFDANGHAQGEATDSSGMFALIVPVGVELRCTFVGYEPQAVTVTASGPINFTLQGGVDIPEVEIFGDAPAAPWAVVVGLGATLLALLTSDKSNRSL